MASQKQSLGRWGEDVAAQYLENLGYAILERNIRNEHGEIDLLAQQGVVLVFVEVKARSSNDFGHPEEAVTESKQQHLLDAAQNYLQLHPELDGDWRVDVVAISRLKNSPPEIVHFENALNG